MPTDQWQKEYGWWLNDKVAAERAESIATDLLRKGLSNEQVVMVAQTLREHLGTSDINHRAVYRQLKRWARIVFIKEERGRTPGFEEHMHKAQREGAFRKD